jgi:hypothetical protein
MKKIALAAFILSYSVFGFGQHKHDPVYQGKSFTLYADRVIQGKFQAEALSSTEIHSSYESPANEYMSPRIDFKFSINGKDNEMLSGKDHHFVCNATNELCETPLIEFGKQFNDSNPVPVGIFLQPDTQWKIRLDMRGVFAEFDSKGYYETFNGSKIYKADFKGVYIAGGIPPLTWDFDNLHHFKHLQLQDDNADHIYELTLKLNSKADKKSNNAHWKLSQNITEYPEYTSAFPLVDALYNLSLEEMTRAVEKDSTLRTGKEWAGVWTRDVSYSIILSMAILQTKAAKYSLLRKVKDGVIIQDTGTGGAYPISTDRTIWAVAAWEIYKVTGDKEWLKKTYPIIKKSIEADLENAIDAKTGLVKGESSFLDWREQTYPEWMQPADIFESQCLGTNAVHYEANLVLAAMAEELKDRATAAKHKEVAAGIKKAVNDFLWLKDKKYYGQFRYGRNFDLLSPRSETLGEALCVLFDIADVEKQNQVISNTPVNDFGTPCIYPQIPNMPPYHNNAIWPFVQSYWAMAAAKAGNESAVLHSLASIWRPAALFLTNKENFVASNGDYASTQINSDNMLWSLSGNISMIYKVLFGMEYKTNSLAFKPFVPQKLGGKQVLKNFRYRNAILDITLAGYGNNILSITLDGKPLKNAEVPASLSGKHSIEIILKNNSPGGNVNMLPHHESPGVPSVVRHGSKINWTPAIGLTYNVISNGKLISSQRDTAFVVTPEKFQEIQIIAVDEQGYESFASDPLIVVSENMEIKVEAERFVPQSESRYAGYSGEGYARTSLSGNMTIHFTMPVSSDGVYAIDFRYANGNGPVNTENKCAMRSLLIDGKEFSTVVLPQRGKEEWSDWGFSNVVIADLTSGDHRITLTYKEHNANMNGDINEAVIDYVRLIRIN